jgi:hypothetical protein
MPQGKAHQVWIEQCEATKTIRARFGLKAAFEYLVGEKLLNFAETAVNHANFAQELPRFVSEVRRMFTPEEIEAQLPGIERVQNDKSTDDFDEKDPFRESPAEAAERVRCRGHTLLPGHPPSEQHYSGAGRCRNDRRHQPAAQRKQHSDVVADERASNTH